MHEPGDPVSRRVVLKSAVVSGAGLLADSAFVGNQPAIAESAGSEVVLSNEEWFAKRAWSVSANRVVANADGIQPPLTSLATRIHEPSSADEIAEIVKSLPVTTPIACVCGGHESSNVALIASGEAVILDLVRLKSIEFGRLNDENVVTVGAGVVFRELVEAVKDQSGALPVGTGPGVGVAGYVTNGGLSSYFSRRLGLLGQRVVQMTVVTAVGEIRVLTPDDELFVCMLGAGSALAIVVDLTLRLAEASAIRGAEQRVFTFASLEQAVRFSRGATSFMRDEVIPNESVSLEVVVTGSNALVATTVFYDTFDGDPADFVRPLEELATSIQLPLVAQAHWGSWYEAAAALWPVIAEQRGAPLATLYHCVGTVGAPSDEILDFVCNTVVGEAPLEEAALSIIEIRTLGGAAQKGTRVPSGNCHHAFFVDLVTLYDAQGKSNAERREIVDRTNQIVDKARGFAGLGVDFSGTHSQPDDPNRSVVAEEVFGSLEMAGRVKTMKKSVDPSNRLRFHPFAKFLQ